MVHGTSYDLVYNIEFINPVDWFDVILQKQIDSRFEFIEATKTSIVIKIHRQIFNRRKLENHEIICDKYCEIKQKFNFDNILFLELNNDPKKYEKIRYIYTAKTYYNNLLYTDTRDEMNNIIDTYIEKNKLDYEETVYELELFLEEFKLFVNGLKLEESEQNAINLIIQDPKLSSNIKFAGWKDRIVHY
jgi:hypothetical protein